MNFRLAKHAEQEMARRGIAREIVEDVLTAPAQKVLEHGAIVCYQSIIEINRKSYLVRVMVNETTAPPTVVTVYRTSKIEKYWRTT